MRFTSLWLLVMLVFSPFIAIAQNQPNRISKSKLKDITFSVDQLNIRITKFNPVMSKKGLFLVPWAIPLSPLLKGHGTLDVEIENRSSNPTNYDPYLLSIVDSNNKQINIFEFNAVTEAHPTTKSIVAGAHISERYILNNHVKLPARLFYNGMELALITD